MASDGEDSIVSSAAPPSHWPRGFSSQEEEELDTISVILVSRLDSGKNVSPSEQRQAGMLRRLMDGNGKNVAVYNVTCIPVLIP